MSVYEKRFHNLLLKRISKRQSLTFCRNYKYLVKYLKTILNKHKKEISYFKLIMLKVGIITNYLSLLNLDTLLQKFERLL